MSLFDKLCYILLERKKVNEQKLHTYVFLKTNDIMNTSKDISKQQGIPLALS